MFSGVSLLRNQYSAGLAAAATILVCGSCFVWVTPLLPRLSENEDALVRMSLDQQSWLVALFEVGALLSPFPAGYVADKWGRRIAILIGMPFLLSSWLVVLRFKCVFGFYTARLLQGAALGFVGTAAGIYISEISSDNARGLLTSIQQGMWYTGFVMQYVTGSFLDYETNVHVNLAIVLLLFMFLATFQEETPYHLVKIGQEEKALQSLLILRGKGPGQDPRETENEMERIVESVKMEMSVERPVSWKDLVETAADRKILLVTQLLTAARILCGNISVSTYINILLQTDETTSSSKLATVIYGAVTLVTIISASFLVDIIGRRPLLLVSTFGAFLANLGCAAFFYFPHTHPLLPFITPSTSHCILPFLLTALTFFFSIGLGPVTQAVQSELLPSHTRGLGNVVSLINVTITGLVTLRCYQVVVDLFGVYANFFLYSVVCLSCFLFVKAHLPETRGKSLLEIRRHFIDEATEKVEVTKF